MTPEELKGKLSIWSDWREKLGFLEGDLARLQSSATQQWYVQGALVKSEEGFPRKHSALQVPVPIDTEDLALLYQRAIGKMKSEMAEFEELVGKL